MTAVSHPLIFASRVKGTPVKNRDGETLGHVDDLSIDKISGEVRYALMSFGGFLGIGERLHPVPWSVLDYDTEQGGYVVPLTKAQLLAAPSLDQAQLETLGAGETWRSEIADYYATYGGGLPMGRL
ncbi:PRC-barrel domain-containing protein [Brevundimonas staleyi]|uniref:PRC-barrel domain-containing protein n=1 Tax=Brevundimonas staleyi TaxID=74326 RepID=A0ABW0FS58_9CAUL